MPKKRQIISKRVSKHENNDCIEKPMDAPKVETNGVITGYHSSESVVSDSKVIENKIANKTVNQTPSPSSAANDVLTAPPPVYPSQPIVPPLVLTQKSTKNDKKSQNSFAIVGKKSTQNEDRRVTRHSPQNPSKGKGATTAGSPAKAPAANTSTNGRTTATTTSLLSPLSSPHKANTKQQPVVAHKRSPSSPVPNTFINANLIRATKSQPTPVLKANFLAAQKLRAEAISSPKIESKRPKRKLESKKASVKGTTFSTVPEENGEPRVSKRVRLQYQPFQSPEPLPVMPLMYRASTSTSAKKEDDEKLIIYQNNEFLAVRNETNSYFICRAKQNVFKNSRKFRIQWFNNDSNPLVYTPDYLDKTDFECILTNLTLNRLDKGQYALPDEEKQRILNILQRAINVEKGINERPNPIDVTADGVDISIVGKVDEKELLKKISPKRVKPEVTKTRKQSSATSADSSKSVKTTKTSARLNKRESNRVITNGPSSASKTPTIPKALTTRTSKTDSNSKVAIRRSTRSTGSKTPTVSPTSSKGSPKVKKPGIADVVKKLKTRAAHSAKKQEVVQKKKVLTSAKKQLKKIVSPKKKSPKVTHSSTKISKTAPKQVTTPPKIKKRFTLQPNLSVTLYEKDPFFESNKTVPLISTLIDSKLLIRAVLLKDNDLLEKLIHNKKKICSFCVPRCLAIDRNALSYAIELEDFKAIDLLMDSKLAEHLAPFPDLMLTTDSTGFGSDYMFGHALRAVNVGRGGKEGNNALIKDSDLYRYGCARYVSEVSDEEVVDAIKHGIKLSTIERLCAQSGEDSTSKMNLFLENIVVAVRHGNCKLAHDLVELAIKRGGFGFNELHRQALSKGKQFSQFRAVSILKKSTTNSRITPIHCAAINPDPYFLTTLLSQRPDYAVMDLEHWTPIHYASVCEVPNNLEYILAHGVSSLMVEKEGNTPMHLACLHNRSRNVEVIARHEASSTEGTATASTLEKLNRSGLSPLHIAAKEGFTNVVKELLKAGADAEKPTAATADKLTPLMIAAQFGHLNVVKLFVECGVNIEAVDKKHRTALTMAVMNGHSHVVSYLLRLGANPNSKDSSGNSLIIYACAYGWYYCFRLLLEAKARPNDANDWKMTPLCIAFMKGHTGMAEAIIKESDVNIDNPVDDTNGMNLLMKTCDSKPNELMIEKLKFLVERGADCTKTDFNGNNCLHYLVKNENNVLNEKIAFDKELEEDSTKSDEEFYDAFQSREMLARKQELTFLATHHKELRESQRETLLEAAQLLMDKNCDPSALNKENMSPFMLSAKLGSFSILQKLLELNRKQLNSQTNSDGNTILHLFVGHAINEITTQSRRISVGKFVKDIYETEDSLKKIFQEMSSISNKNGLKPIHLFLQTYSGQYSNEEIQRLMDYLRFLTETLESDINSSIIADKPENNESICHLIAKCKSRQIVEFVLSKNPNLEQLDGNKRTGLTVAIVKKNIEISKLLIESGAEVRFKSEKDSNLSLLLLEAIKNSKTFQLIPLLVAKGADVNEHEVESGNCALHYIAAKADQKAAPDAVRALINAGANVNAVNKIGRTPLHLSVNSRRGGTDVSFEVEELLLKAGAKTDIKDQRGRIALHYTFVKIGGHRDHSFMDPIELVALLDPSDSQSIQDHNIDIADNFGSTPLHYAAQRGATISCMHLLRRVNINPIDDNNNTPLGLAVLYGHEGCALMLQQKGSAFIKPIGNLNRKPDLRFKDEKSYWKWNKLKDEEKLSRELEAKKAHCSIIEEVVRNDWQGILYLMINELATIGKGVGIAVEAALKTERLNLAIKLLKRTKQNRSLFSTEQTLLHIMAKECVYESNRELQQLIVKLLVEHEVQVLALDSQFKSNAIIYAAINWNYILCNELTELLSLDRVVNLEPDLLLRTPLTAIFWDLHNQPSNRQLPEEMKSWLMRLLEKNIQKLNVLSYYPISESSYAGVRYIGVNATPATIAGAPKYSPLIFSVICGNYSLVKYLLNLKINGSFVVDVNYTDSYGRTPLMHSVRLNDLKMVKLLLNRSYSPEDDRKAWDSRCLTFENKNGVDMTAKDQNGWTVLHHLVSPLPNFTYLNSDVLLRLLWQVTNNSKPEIQLFDVSNSGGETPLQIAVNRNAKNLIKTLKELLKSDTNESSAEVLPPFPRIETNFIDEEFDYKLDSTKMIEKFNSEIMETDGNEPMFTPDSLIDIENAEVLSDTTLDLPFDVLLTKVDIEYGIYGLYNFYKMQIIVQKKKDLVLLFTRWGRIGDIGQYQKTPFSTLDDAIKEFKKVFKAKTGNNWESVKQFSAVPKRYRLVDSLRRVKPNQRQYKIDVKSALESVEHKLPEPLFDLMTSLIDVNSSQETYRSYGSGSESFTPFGFLKNETLTKAENILQTIEGLIEEKDKMSRKDSFEYSKAVNEIIDLSEQFYHLIPLFGHQFERLSPFLTHNELREKMELICNLVHYEYAFELLLGAQYRTQDVNPADYIYRCLGCHLQLLDKNEEESQLILQYIQNTEPKPVVKSIYKINRNGEEDRFTTAGVGNNWLLWHGTKAANILSILANGLMKAPLGAQISGHLFGKGIYFADMFSKSRTYCSLNDNFDKKYMFLCEVSLGDVEDVQTSGFNTDILKSIQNKTKHSLKASHTLYRPDPQSCVYWKGRSVPMGPAVRSDRDSYDINYNEYIVFNCSQICLRYLIEFNN